jgi:hypothetical protein
MQNELTRLRRDGNLPPEDQNFRVPAQEQRRIPTQEKRARNDRRMKNIDQEHLELQTQMLLN